MDVQVTAQLSPLSQQVLVSFTDGKKIETIASELGTTRHVVNGHLRRIYRHFRVRGIAQLVHAAIREGWIEHPAETNAMAAPAVLPTTRTEGC